MANSGNSARPTTKLKEAVSTLVRGGDRRLLHNLLLDLVSSLTISFAFRLIQWNPAPAVTPQVFNYRH
jgi:hypothetical protein